MEAVLVTRTSGSGSAAPSTTDYRLEITLGDSKPRDGVATPLPQSEWPGAQDGSYGAYVPVDWSYRPHTLAKFSPFGSGQTNEFATWTMGREMYLSSAKLREECENDVRTFAERSDQTEGFMISTPVSDGFGGFTSAFVETLRDEFGKSAIFTTATLSDASSWSRPDTERARAQRLLNTALSIQHFEELSSMLLPLQPPCSWEPDAPWANYLREDLPMANIYTSILTMHLQSMNSELREVDGLTTIINQLNWRGDNKIAHLTGAVPLLPPHMLQGETGLKTLQASVHDFSILVSPSPTPASSAVAKVRTDKPFAQYSIVRGYEKDELQELGTILEASTPLQEPLSAWIALPSPYPIQPSAPPLFRSLIPSGRPLIIAPPPHPEPLSHDGLFGLPSPMFPASLSRTYYVQPTFVPILTTLDTSTAARHLLVHLHAGIKELQRIRAGVLREYEDGEYGIGREGLSECRERLETLADGLATAGGVEESDNEGGADDDENFDMD